MLRNSIDLFLMIMQAILNDCQRRRSRFWYFHNLEQYPQTKQYIEQLDRLRLLMLEYFNQRLSTAA